MVSIRFSTDPSSWWMRWRIGLISLVILILTAAMGVVWNRHFSLAAEMTRLRQDASRITVYRPGEIDRSHVERLDLTINGRPFFPGPHRLRYSECQMTGFFKPRPPAGPPKSWGHDLVISLRPAETADGEWKIEPDQFHPQRCWKLAAGYDQNVVKPNGGWKTERYFVPGDYRADLFYELKDSSEGKNRVFLLGTVAITLVSDQAAPGGRK